MRYSCIKFAILVIGLVVAAQQELFAAGSFPQECKYTDETTNQEYNFTINSFTGSSTSCTADVQGAILDKCSKTGKNYVVIKGTGNEIVCVVAFDTTAGKYNLQECSGEGNKALTCVGQ